MLILESRRAQLFDYGFTARGVDSDRCYGCKRRRCWSKCEEVATFIDWCGVIRYVNQPLESYGDNQYTRHRRLSPDLAK